MSFEDHLDVSQANENVSVSFYESSNRTRSIPQM